MRENLAALAALLTVVVERRWMHHEVEMAPQHAFFRMRVATGRVQRGSPSCNQLEENLEQKDTFSSHFPSVDPSSRGSMKFYK